MEYMKRALELARLGIGKVNPNPLVGAVIVKDNKIIGEGYHKVFGGNHAEVEAFNNAIADVTGADMYVTLEPCSHYGKTPPCALKIIEKDIKRVYVGLTDPNPLVAGKGIQMLRNAGIEVITDVLTKECSEINKVFLKYISQGLPYVVLKTAMTLDGKIASYSGNSKWVTSKESRQYVQEMRNGLSGIMVGIGTVLADNPALTCRILNSRNPKRIIVDSSLKIPLNSKVLADTNCIIATTNNADTKKYNLLIEKGFEVYQTSGMQVDLKQLMHYLGKMGIDSILLEGGGELNFSALKSGIVDEVIAFIAPKIIGGSSAKTPVEGKGIEIMNNAIELKNISLKTIGTDIVIQGRLN